MKFPGQWIEFARAPDNDGGAGDGTGADASGGTGGTPAGGDADGAAPSPAFDWAATLGDKHAGFAPVLSAKGWKDPADALTAYTALETEAASRIAIPGTDATDEQRAAFFTALGRPATPADYGIAKPENVPDAEWDGERMGRFATAAHALGLSAAQAKGLIDWLGTDTVEQIAAFEADLPKRQAEHQAKLNAALTKEFGAATQGKLELARRAYATYVTDAETQAGIDALSEKVGEAAIIKMFARIAEDQGEARLKGAGGGFGAATPEQARAELATKERDQDWMAAVFQGDHPQHATALAEWQRLKLLAAGQAAS